jgi:REP element-mobilizing transposase RayT
MQYSQRRHPAHHAPVERFNEPVIVQVNVCTKDRYPTLACEAGHRLCREIWQVADFWHVGQYMIMPDHIHLFCTPGRRPMPSLKNWVEYWKAQIAARWPRGNGFGTEMDGTALRRCSGQAPVPPGEKMDATAGVPPESGFGGSPSVATIDIPEGRNGGSASMRTVLFKLWQRDFWDTQMRSRTHYEEKLSYVRMNPVRKELVSISENWPYQGEVFPISWV